MVCAGAAAAAAAAALALLSVGARANLATGVPPSLYDYDYNGVTTYCYWIKQPLNVSSFDYSYTKLEGKGKQCPLEITISQTTPTPIFAKSDVQYQFTATLNFDSNSFGMTGLEAIVLDPATKRPVQIAHANVHACSRTTVCDVFRDGANRRISNQETSNFTDGKATFNQRVNFAAAGDYNVFAHIVLPPKNAAEETYQFITFTTTTITSTAATQTTSSDSGMATGTMVGVIVGSVALLLVIVIGVIFYRRKKPDMMMTPGHDHFRHSGYGPSRTTKSKASRLDWNGDPEFQFGHDRYQASMVSEYNKQPPALSASALMFQDNRSSRHTKLSSAASSNRSGGSPRFNDNGRRTQGIELPDHGIETYDTYYHDGYGDNSTLHSYTTDSSMGTTNAYPSNAHLYGGTRSSSTSQGIPGYDAPPPFESKGPYPYDRESDLSSLNDYEYGDNHHGGHDGLRTVSELDRDSDASMGTVDFALPPPIPLDSLRPTGDSFRAEDVPNLADTKLAFNDDEISKQTIEYIDSLRKQNYRDTEQASDYASDFGSTNRTFDFRDSAQSDNLYTASFRSSTDDQFTDTAFRHKRTTSNDSESYEF